jgi:hypothetical protein
MGPQLLGTIPFTRAFRGRKRMKHLTKQTMDGVPTPKLECNGTLLLCIMHPPSPQYVGLFRCIIHALISNNYKGFSPRSTIKKTWLNLSYENVSIPPHISTVGGCVYLFCLIVGISIKLKLLGLGSPGFGVH